MEMRLRTLALGWMLAFAGLGITLALTGSTMLAQVAYSAAVFPQILIEWHFPKQFSWWEVRRATRFLYITACIMVALLIVNVTFSAFLAAFILYIMVVKFQADLILKYFFMMFNMLLWAYYIWLLLMHKKPPPKKPRRATAKTRAPRWTWRPQPLSRHRLPRRAAQATSRALAAAFGIPPLFAPASAYSPGSIQPYLTPTLGAPQVCLFDSDAFAAHKNAIKIKMEKQNSDDESHETDKSAISREQTVVPCDSDILPIAQGIYHGMDSRNFCPALGKYDKQNRGHVKGRALTEISTPKYNNREDVKKWKLDVADQVRDQIYAKLRVIPRSHACNLHVAFSRMENATNKQKPFPDIDNMLKVFLDPLQKKYGSGKDGAGLISDDVLFRGIRAERKVVETIDDEMVEFEYYLTRSYRIVDVTPLTLHEVQEKLRGYWQHEMQLISVRSILADFGTPDEFIDNLPGNVFRGENSEKEGVPVVPGFDWEKHRGEIVEGCMTFCRKPSTPEDGKPDSFWWLNKWS